MKWGGQRGINNRLQRAGLTARSMMMLLLVLSSVMEAQGATSIIMLALVVSCSLRQSPKKSRSACFLLAHLGGGGCGQGGHPGESPG